MKYELTSTGSRRLIILFAGWSTRPSLYRDSARAGFDLMTVYDYTDFSFPADAPIGGYEEICVVAWSYGVAAAHRWLVGNPSLPVTRTLAVNGTPWPVDDRRGIPQRVFGLTLRTLSEASVEEFRRRMFARDAEMPVFERVGIAQLREELEAIVANTRDLPAAWTETAVWDKVIISANDRIIPPANQVEAWSGHHDILTTDWPHFPDWERVMAMASVDKDAVERNFSHGAPTYDGEATVQRVMAERLSEIWRASAAGKELKDVIEIGPGTGLFTRNYSLWLQDARLRFWDLATIGPDLPGDRQICDAETEIRRMADASVDAIVSAATVQWFNSLRRFLIECRRVLCPGGVVVISTFGRSTFRELAGIVTPAATYLDGRDLTSLVPDGIDVAVTDDGPITVEFESPSALLRHMSQTGVNTSSSGSVAAARSIIRNDIHTLTYQPVYAVFTRK